MPPNASLFSIIELSSTYSGQEKNNLVETKGKSLLGGFPGKVNVCIHSLLRDATAQSPRIPGCFAPPTPAERQRVLLCYRKVQTNSDQCRPDNQGCPVHCYHLSQGILKEHVEHVAMCV